MQRQSTGPGENLLTSPCSCNYRELQGSRNYYSGQGIQLSSASVYLRAERRKSCTAEQNARWENNRKRPLEDQKDGETLLGWILTKRDVSKRSD
jgi:hypothetical protein